MDALALSWHPDQTKITTEQPISGDLSSTPPLPRELALDKGRYDSSNNTYHSSGLRSQRLSLQRGDHHPPLRLPWQQRRGWIGSSSRRGRHHALCLWLQVHGRREGTEVLCCRSHQRRVCKSGMWDSLNAKCSILKSYSPSFSLKLHYSLKSEALREHPDRGTKVLWMSYIDLSPLW